MIQAHHQEELLYELVKSLLHPKSAVVIHIDKKSDISIFKKILQEFEDIYFVKNRENIIWKGYSQIQGSLNTLKESIKINCKHYVQLSGVDYPIKSIDKIIEFYEKTNKNYINHKEINYSNSYIDFFKNKNFWFKFSKWHFYDTLKIHWNSRNGSLKHQLFRLYILLNIGFFNLFLPSKKLPKYIKKYYFGSSWWSINEDSAEYIISFLDDTKHKNFVNIFYYSDSPDEMVFQTILLNSKYKDLCVDDNLRYIDWDKKREGPAVLDDRDFLKIKKSDKLFARKFDIKKSATLIKKLKNEN